MEKRFQIKDIAELFQIEKSTIRYWQSEGLLPTIKGENGYRQFTVQDILELSDILLYRDLHMPVKFLKDRTDMDLEQLHEVLEKTQLDVISQINQLNDTVQKIEERKKRIQTVYRLQADPYRDAVPDMKQIAPFPLLDIQKFRHYLTDQYCYVRIFKAGASEPLNGIVIDKISGMEQHEIIWQFHADKQYKTCLLKTDTNADDQTDLPFHIDALRRRGFRTGETLGRYLLTAKETASIDYYQAWIEIL